MIIKSYEIRNSLGLINTIERTSTGWYDNVAKKTLDSAQKEELLKSYRSFNCQLQTVYIEPDKPEMPALPEECIAIEFVAKDHYTGIEIIMYAAIRIEDYWLIGIKVPSARCQEKYIQDMIFTHSKREIEVRYYDKYSKRIEC